MAEDTVIEGQEVEGDPRKDVSSRINQLSQKISEASKETEKERKAREKAEAEALANAKERDFYKNFNTLIPKYQGASELQDEIREKVMSGYDIEDATISVLAKKGKYQPVQPEVEREFVAGGSASTNPNAGSGKSMDDLVKSGSNADRRKKLEELLG